MAMEPAPEVTLITRGMPFDFWRSGAKDSSIKRGPVVLVWKACDIFSASEPVGMPMAALLTSASSLIKLVSPRTHCQGGEGGNCRVYAYLPCLLSTNFAAAVIDSSLATSTCNSSTVPG